MKPVLFLAFVCLTLAVRTFHGNQVFRVWPTNDAHVRILETIQANKVDRVDFWTEIALGASVDIHLEPTQIPTVLPLLQASGVKIDLWIEDVQTLVEQQLEKPTADWLATYHTYDEIITWVTNLPRKFPLLASLVNIGKSYEGRDLLAVRISSNKSQTPVGAWFDGGLHAREWITTATTLWMANQLLTDYGKDPIVTHLLDNMVITVLPVFNPDGYSWTWTNNRMWRKTRTPNPGSNCIGTDPNRNWDFHWGEAGTSPDPCSDAYEGPKAFSEIEVKTVAHYIAAQKNIQGYINFHSYSQLWMSPWGYTSNLPKDYNKQNALSASCVNALGAVFGTSYQYGPISTTIYPASGSSADWTYGVANVLYSYGVELRDTGTYGFLLPPDQIVPSGQETYAAVKVWLQRVLSTQ